MLLDHDPWPLLLTHEASIFTIHKRKANVKGFEA